MNSPSPPCISLLAALARNGVIGRDGALPWHLPEDLKRFKTLTLGHPVVMGRKTFDSIIATLGKPLPSRANIVITRSGTLPDRRPEWHDVHAVASLDEAIAAAGSTEEAFVIGGAQIYALALPRARRLYMTEVLSDVQGDTSFPPWNPAEWHELSREHGTAAPSGLQYDFVVYERH